MFKINSINTQLKYEGKYLFEGAKKYTGTFFTPLSRGKKLCFDYKDGLLKNVSGPSGLKTYEYDKGNRLIKVKNDGKDIFEKIIKHNIGLEYTREEQINNTIGKIFDSQNRLIKYVVSHKLIFGFIKYIDKISIDTRYFLNNAKYLGEGRIRVKFPQGDPILNNGVIDKTIVRDLSGKGISVVKADGNHYKGSFKNSNGLFNAELDFYTDKNGKPLWTHLSGENNKWSYDKKVKYDDFGRKIREIYSECDGKWFIENTFDAKGNIILSRKLNQKGETIQTTKSKFNELNLIEQECVYDKKGKLVNKTIYSYYPNKSIRTENVTYYDSFGSYQNISFYDENKDLIKLKEVNEDLVFETYYDKNSIIKSIEKERNGKIKTIKEYINDDTCCVKAIVKDGKHKIKYQTEHSVETKKDLKKDINTFKTHDNKLIGKEFIILNDKTGEVKTVYTNKDGKRIDDKSFCKLLGVDEI